MKKPKSGFIHRQPPGYRPLALNLVLLLVSRNSAGMLPEIAAPTAACLNRLRGIENCGRYHWPCRWMEADTEKLKTQLGAVIGARVELNAEVDPGILGGHRRQGRGPPAGWQHQGPFTGIKKEA
jgi:F0F1-type ATP synthase delta subunit